MEISDLRKRLREAADHAAVASQDATSDLDGQFHLGRQSGLMQAMRLFRIAESGHKEPADCLSAGTLKFQGHIAAPGYGQSWECSECHHPFVRIGENFHDATVNVFELTPEDVR